MAGCAPSITYAQADFIAPSERAPMTRLPTCAIGSMVGACFDFENKTLDRWQLAEWATASDGYVDGTVDRSSDAAGRSGTSLRVQTQFSPVGWSAVALELRADVSLADYVSMRADVHPPADSPLHLAVRFVIVAGPAWDWFETRESIPLDPGNWSTAHASLQADAWHRPGYAEAADGRQWNAFLRDVHKIIVRFEASPGRGDPSPAELTTIAVDNIWFPEHDGR
jgi:hypothetical protein